MPAVRCPNNPIITPAEVRPSRPELEVVGAFNPGAVRFGQEVLLLVRVAERPKDVPADCVVGPRWNAHIGRPEFFTIPRDDPQLTAKDRRIFHYRGQFHTTSLSHLRLARSRDGENFQVPEGPTLFPSTAMEALGLEDPRITPIEGTFLITAKVVGCHGIAVALLRTHDFETFESLGLILQPENLDVAIFPERIGGQYVAWTRPVCSTVRAPEMWMVTSGDLIHWGNPRPVLSPRPGRWDGGRVGAGCVPIPTEHGWLEIYHAATPDNVYALGALLTDLHRPDRVLARSSEPILRPEAPYELEGFFGQVVFACGHVMEDADTAAVYYGAADECTCLARISLSEVLNQLARDGP